MSTLVDDLETVVEAACVALEGALDRDWGVPADGLDWTCWGTVEHTADDLFAYATQLSARRPTLGGYVPVLTSRSADGEPANAVHGDPAHGTAGLVHVLDACGGLLVAVTRHAPATARGGHPSGPSDPEGFAAMGTVEVLLHLHDVAGPLGLTWTPPADVVARVLDRLFPDVEPAPDPWATLLWASGRGDLPGRARRAEWSWDSRVREGRGNPGRNRIPRP